MANGHIYTLTLPADEASLIVVRLTASGVASRFTTDLETLEDFKTAVYEACYAILHQRHRPERLEIHFDIENGLYVEICGIGNREETKERMPDERLCHAVLCTIASEVSINRDDLGLTAINMRHVF